MDYYSIRVHCSYKVPSQDFLQSYDKIDGRLIIAGPKRSCNGIMMIFMMSRYKKKVNKQLFKERSMEKCKPAALTMAAGAHPNIQRLEACAMPLNK